VTVHLNLPAGINDPKGYYGVGEGSAAASIFTVGIVSQDAFADNFLVTGGAFNFAQQGNDVFLTYSIPEPTTPATIRGGPRKSDQRLSL